MNPFFEEQWRDAHTMLIAYRITEISGEHGIHYVNWPNSR
jgi:hypothetical protein